MYYMLIFRNSQWERSFPVGREFLMRGIFLVGIELPGEKGAS